MKRRFIFIVFIAFFSLLSLFAIPFDDKFSDNPALLYKHNNFEYKIDFDFSFNAFEIIENIFFKNALNELPDVSNLTFSGLLGAIRRIYNGTSTLISADLGAEFL